MDLRHLKYFIAVADEQNFTRAAEKLHISQPPLSRQIQQIEEELGLQLFERGSRPLKLTEAGRFFYTHATRLLEQAGEIANMTRRIAQVERRLVIGFVSSTLYGGLPKVVRLFRAANPQTELTLIEMSTVDQLEALKAGRIDVGFGRIRLDDPNVRREVLREERLVAALPCEHPLLAKPQGLTLLDIAAYPVLIYPRKPRPSYADQVLSVFKDRGIEPAALHEVQELQTALGLVAAGMGLCLVPASVQRLQRDDVIYRPLDEPNVVTPIIMSTRLHDQSQEIALLRSLIDDMYRAHAQERQFPT